MTIETVLSCPLGSKCEEVKDGKVHKCAWFVTLAGQNPQTGEQIDEKGCAMSWMPVLLVENARVTRGTGAAVESFRNEMVKANNASLSLLLNAAQSDDGRLLGNGHDARPV
jgi:hypothetical protein